MRAHRLVAGLALIGAAVGCADEPRGSDLVVYVSAPVTAAPWLATGLERGARLAVEEVNAAGGLGTDHRRLRLVVGDHRNTVQGARDRAADAVREGAVLFLTDGVGVVKASEVTAAAHIPTVITFDGGEGLLDEDRRPHVFRLAPANRPMTRRLADYLAELRPRLAVLHDDSSYGVDGVADFARGLATNRLAPVVTVQIPGSAADVAPQILRARRAGADTVVVWARAPVVAAVVRAMRGTEWEAPIYAGPTAEDPLVRQQVADHPAWLDGLTFVSFRITSEVGPAPFAAFRAAYESRFDVPVRRGAAPRRGVPACGDRGQAAARRVRHGHHHRRERRRARLHPRQP